MVALPLSLLLLKKLRADLDVALAETGKRRRARKASLRAQLRGEVAPESGKPGEGQADGGAQRPGEHDHTASAEHGDQLPAADPAEHPPNR